MHPLQRPKIDLCGLRVGRLLVISYSTSTDGRKAWVCHCDCGSTVEVRGVNLRSGKTKSCGCLKADLMAEGLRKTHGMYGSKVNKSWSSMIGRCHNEKDPSYPDYGGRGITVCERWMSFKNFYEDMGNRPEGKTLDRIDNLLGYEPGNCKWSTASEQQNNRRNSRRFIFRGIGYTSLYLSEVSGIKYHSLRSMLRRCGDDVEAAMSRYKVMPDDLAEMVLERGGKA